MRTPLTSDDPRKVGPFILRERLGSGPLGTVYLGRKPDGSAAAVRVVRTEPAGDPGFRGRFAGDVAAAARVRGQHVATVVDSDTAAGHPWLATEYVAGPTLREAVGERGPLPVLEVLRLTAGIADALASIHDAGVLHGALDASDVVLAEDGEPRVVDFGIAAAAPGAGPADDIHALGMLITYLAPASREGVDGVAVPLRDLVARCLAADPADRPGPREIVELCSAELARPAGNPLAYVGVEPPANPLDLSAGSPDVPIVGPLTAPVEPAAESAAENPLAYPATAPPENPLDLSAGIPGDAIVGPIPVTGEEATATTPAEAVDQATAQPVEQATGDPVDIAAEVAKALAEVDAANAAAAAPPSPRPRTPGRRRRLLAGLAAGVLLAAVIPSLGYRNYTPGTPIPDHVTTAPAAIGPTCTGTKHLIGGGSALQHDAVTMIAEKWAARCAGSTVDYMIADTTLAVHRFAAGQSDVALADHALGNSEADRGELAAAAARCAGVGAPADTKYVLQVPLVITPIVLVYQLPGITRLRLDPPALTGIFSGKLTRWNDPRIAKLNPGVRLPATPITVVARGGQATSTETLQQYLTATGDWQTGQGPTFTGKSAAAVFSDAAVLAAVHATAGAIGYVPYSATQSGDAIASLVTSYAAATPDPGTIRDTVDAAVDALLPVTDYTRLPSPIFGARPGAGSVPYPLLHVGYAVACTQYPDEHTAAAVRDFLLTSLDMGGVPTRGYQLPSGLLRRALIELVERTY
jgi:ABC-type phosphate transport system substrate-binding protein